MTLGAVVQAGLAPARLVHFRAHWHGLPNPQPGEWMIPIASQNRRRVIYEIVSVRPTRSSRYPLRLSCRRYPIEHKIPEGARTYQWISDKRASRPRRRWSPLL